MMQHAHRVAKLRGGGPILTGGPKDHVWSRVAATSDRHRQTLLRARQLGCALFSSLSRGASRRPQDDALRHLAGGDETPQCD
jgi:hypothetical protein